MKPGYKTTEFYVTSFTQLVSLAVMMGFIGQDLGDTAVELVSGYVAPMVVMAVSAYAYIKSRTAVKATGQDLRAGGGMNSPVNLL